MCIDIHKNYKYNVHIIPTETSSLVGPELPEHSGFFLPIETAEIK